MNPILAMQAETARFPHSLVRLTRNLTNAQREAVDAGKLVMYREPGKDGGGHGTRWRVVVLLKGAHRPRTATDEEIMYAEAKWRGLKLIEEEASLKTAKTP